jgi:hypothetical protein
MGLRGRDIVSKRRSSGEFKHVRTDRILRWVRRQPLEGLFLMIMIVVVGAEYVIISSGKVHVTTVSAASAILTSAAQVCATFAGFLVVAIVYLIEKRRPILGGTLSFWGFLDLALFLVAALLFAWVALSSIENLGYLLSDSELSTGAQNSVLSVILATKIGMWLLAIGFGYLIGFNLGYHKGGGKK